MIRRMTLILTRDGSSLVTNARVRSVPIDISLNPRFPAAKLYSAGTHERRADEELHLTVSVTGRFFSTSILNFASTGSFETERRTQKVHPVRVEELVQ